MATDDLTIRPGRDGDFDALWPVLRDVIRAGDTYAIDPGLSRDGARAYWMQAPRATCVAMQFNFVAAIDTGAIRLWQRPGFETAGRLPGAFRHPEAGLTDALVMYKWLGGAGT